MSRRKRRGADHAHSGGGAHVRLPWALAFPTADPDVSNQMRRHGRSDAGTEAKVEARMKEAQRPWTKLAKGFRTARRERGGADLLRGAAKQEARFLALFRRMGGARTDAELGVRNYFYGCMTMWRSTANSGLAFLFGEWVLYAAKHAAKLFRPRLVPALGFHEWFPGPPGLSPKLLDVLERVLFEEMARLQGQVMESVPKSREGIQANYLLAGLLATRIDPELGERRRTALSALAGENSAPARRSQILQELPGAARIAWSEAEQGEDLAGLVKRVNNDLVGGISPDWRLFAHERKPDPALDQVIKNPKRNRRNPEEQPPLVDDSSEVNPEALVETQEAVQSQLKGLIKEHGFTSREAEVVRLRFEGKETAAIADAMGIAAETVRVHAMNIRGKVPRDRAS